MKQQNSRFLEQMEAKRLAKPCPRVLDMRGKVPGECRPHEYRGHSFWLDDLSYDIFRRGLEAHGGVFTVGTYEAIVNGPHTNRALRASAQPNQADPAAPAPERHPAGEEAPAETEQPELVQFGYFRRRTEERIQFATAVALRQGDLLLHGSTRNLSVHGLMLYLRGRHDIAPGQPVRLSFPDFQARADAAIPLSDIPYQVMGVQQGDTVAALRLRLEQEAAPAGFADFLAHFVTGYRKRNRLDVDDEFRATLSRAHERMYAENLVTLPLFVAREGGALRTRAVAISGGNDYLARFFHLGADRYDFLALGLPPRLERLRRRGELVLVLYREGDAIHSADEAEFQDPQQFLRFAAHALRQPRHLVLKLATGCQPLRMPPAARFQRAARLLEQHWREALERIKADYAGMLFSAVAVDLTEMLRHQVSHGTDYLENPPNNAGLSAWCGPRRLALEDGRELEALAEPPAAPAVVDFGLLRSRREARYRAATTVRLDLRGSKVQGTTRDISRNGLCVTAEGLDRVQVGEQVLVGFPVLQQRRENLNLMRLPYQVVKVVPGEQPLLMLQRQRERCTPAIEAFFEELIATNSAKLGAEPLDPRARASAHAWEALAVENLATVPIFFGRKKESGLKVRAVALSIPPCSPLAEFFHTAEGELDFSALSTPQVARAIRERFLPMQREGNVRGRRPDPVSLELYFYKESDAAGTQRVVGADDLQLTTPFQRNHFIREALRHEHYCFVRLVLTTVQPLEEEYRDELLHHIHRQASYRGLQLDQWLEIIEGYGEMVDITDEVVSRLNAR